MGLGSKSEKPPAARRNYLEQLENYFCLGLRNWEILAREIGHEVGEERPATGSFTARAVPRMFGNNMEVFLEVERGFEDETFNLVPPVGSSIDYSLRGAEAQRVINAVDDFVL